MAVNPLITNCFIDSCAFDPKYEPEDKASVEIFKLYEEGKLILLIAHSTQKEIEHPNTPAWVKREALSLPYTIPTALTDSEAGKLREIAIILAGNGKLQSILQDARHVFEAQRYGSYFITTDSRILDRAHMLRVTCNVMVVTPSEFLSIARQHLETQDNQHTNHSLGGSSEAAHSQNGTKTNVAYYKGYMIVAAPYQLADSGEFTVNIRIRRDIGSAVKSRPFGAGNTYKTKEEAIDSCIDFGQQIIDGKYPNCTVNDL